MKLRMDHRWRGLHGWTFKGKTFGELLPDNQVKFTDWKGHKTDTWQIRYVNGTTMVRIEQLIERIDGVYHQQIPVGEVLKNEISFSHIRNPLLVFHQNATNEDTVQLLNNTIYLLKRRGRHRLYLQFDGKVNERRSTIYFSEGRIVYDPRPFFGR